jgi:alanyl-tRNA synthetase
MSVSNSQSSLEWPANRVRETFVDFFVEHANHVSYRSSPVVPHEDPTLLFTNAGMNQFKPIFLGQADPSGPLASLKRAANSQKCIRAGGKHNDLDDVGKDTYHHTFFEMLGNWSFGDYFKEEAITWAWTLLTEKFKLPKDRFYATYFAGDEKFNLPADIEAKNIWLKYLPEERILPFDKKANFWEMGDTGPCGPCSEIHFDRIGGRDASSMVNYDDPTVIEIWNIVFMQFNREPDGSLRELPAKHIDTGMGFERLTSILQGAMSNYDTDIFAPFFAAIQNATGAAPYAGRLGKDDVDGVDMAYRVIADHIRTLTFAIADGAVPSNEGRGYVLRRILRRAVRYGTQFLKAKPGFFHALVPVVTKNFSGAFPELIAKESFVMEVLRDEEESFGRTLSKGIRLFNQISADIKAKEGSVVQGKDAFFLYDSMGFPLDLTQIMASEAGLTVDTEGFQACMAEQRARSQASGKFSRQGVEKLVLEAEETSFLLNKAGVAVTNDSAKYDWFQNIRTHVAAVYLGGKGEEAFLPQGTVFSDSAKTIGVLLKETNFYAESGGQVADLGMLVTPAESESSSANPLLHVSDCQVFGGFVLHVGNLAPGASIVLNQEVECAVDYDRRSFIAPNHTMTHVLNFALRQVLGGNPEQRGSIVQADKLRFDYSTSKAPTAEQLQEIEHIVQVCIDAAQPVYSKVVPLVDAKAICSLRALFGETYPDPVRLISVGQPIEALLENPSNPEWFKYSVELCGGTHLKNSSQAGRFALVEDGAIAKGIRRVIAVTRESALQAHGRAAELELEISAAKALAPGPELEQKLIDLRALVSDAELPAYRKVFMRDALAELGKVLVAHEKAVAKKLEDAAKVVAGEAAAKAVLNKEKFIVADLSVAKGDSGISKGVSKVVSDAAPGLPFLSVSSNGVDKLHVFAFVSNEVIASSGLKANDWVNASLAVVNGKGGGKDDSATGTSKDCSNIAGVLDAARNYAASKFA